MKPWSYEYSTMEKTFYMIYGLSFFFSPLQNFNPSHLGINWEVYWWSSEDPSLPCQVLVLDCSCHHLQTVHLCNTVHVHYHVTILLMRTYSFLQDSTVFLKFSVCLTPEATALKVWRWNSCSFDPFASLWLLCCELYLLLKPSSVK